MSDGNVAQQLQRAGHGRRRAGRRSRATATCGIPKGTPLANLMLGLMDRFGVQMEKFGDSTGGDSICCQECKRSRPAQDRRSSPGNGVHRERWPWRSCTASSGVAPTDTSAKTTHRPLICRFASSRIAGQPWRIAVNVQSDSGSNVAFWIVDPLVGHPLLASLPGKVSGFSTVARKAGQSSRLRQGAVVRLAARPAAAAVRQREQ